ncbi:hypothetical protein [Aquimarina brevivitae]|uniref:Uncharacterized protein n=1 Tax=Aquimarina brevivitae TaxID=323412 RepID=A0A4Q7NYY9_9FLAO|nr:hypothetical protein [Aquimarina brevivitae]RZS92260.1 hypothetical protein EV197_2896 [Aquimarina brevivitae]
MRIFKIWVEYSKELDIDGIKQSSKVYGGSNISESDAIIDAQNKLNRAQRIIYGELQKDEEYESDIVEEIIEKIDDENIVTRNRYGALVLNSKRIMFIDVDNYSKSITDHFFRKNLSVKELMLTKIKKTINQKKYSHLGFRVYETNKGYRILVTNKNFNPRSKESKKMMEDFNADYLYRWLCIKQNCYRARLTPKPYRIKQKGIKVIYPKRSKEQQKQLDDWIIKYEQKSREFSSCHLVYQFGEVKVDKIIEYHDRLSGVKWPNKLA